VTSPGQPFRVDREGVTVPAVDRAGPPEAGTGLVQLAVRVEDVSPLRPELRLGLLPEPRPAGPFDLLAVHQPRRSAAGWREGPASKLSTVSTRWPAAKASRSAMS